MEEDFLKTYWILLGEWLQNTVAPHLHFIVQLTVQLLCK